MQQKSDQSAQNSDFSDRTDALAHHLGIRIAELTDRLDLSRDSLMGYRTGRYPVSPKAWRKLQAAETAAGIQTKTQSQSQSQAGPSQSQSQGAAHRSFGELREGIPAVALRMLDRANFALAHFKLTEAALDYCLEARPHFENEEAAGEFRELLRRFGEDRKRGADAILEAVQALERMAEVEMYKHFALRVGQPQEAAS